MSTWYRSFLESCFTRPANSDLNAGTVKLAFLTSSYVFNAAHDFRDDLTGVIGTPVTISSKSFTNGSFSGTVANYLGSELDGQTVTQIVIFIDTGTPATSRLVMHIDDSANLPTTFPGSGSVDQPISLPAQPLGVSSGAGNDIWYPIFLEALFTRPANSDLSAGTVKAVFIDSADYTYSAAHDFLDDVPGAARVGTPVTLSSKTFVNGVFNAANITFTGLTGDQVEQLLIYIDTGVESTSRLVALKRAVQGMPLTPNGSDQPVVWNSTDGIMKLGATA